MADECVHIGASPCRQNYAKHKYVTVFLYRYIGDDTVTVQPAGCQTQGGWDQCHDDERVTFNGKSGPDVTPIKYGDLSIWFIYSQSNSAPTVIENRVGYVGFSIEYLDQNAQVAIFGTLIFYFYKENVENCHGGFLESKKPDKAAELSFEEL